MAATTSSASVSTSQSSASLIGHSLFLGRRNRVFLGMPRSRSRRDLISVRAEDTQNLGLRKEDGGRWLSSTTRHIRLYAAYIDPETEAMDQTQTDKLSLILDPDDEFIWPMDKAQKVFDKLKELVDVYEGAELTEYTLRLIGSDLEHFIRQMLLANEIKYNPECRVLNFSMGRPRLPMGDEEGGEE